MLIGLRDVHGNPALAVGQEPGPAMVAAHRAGFGGKRESHLELRGDFVAAGHRDEQAVEISAVAILAVAGP